MAIAIGSADPAIFAGIAIEGIGTEGDVSSVSTENDGWLITTSSAAPHISDIENDTSWKVKPWLNFEDLDVDGVEVEIFQAGTYWPAFRGTIEAKDEAAERLVWTQFRAQAVLEERITSSATSLKLDRSDLAEHIIYIGDETIELGSATGTTDGVTTYDVAQRGQYQSQQLAHEAEANVFTSAPYLDSRRIKFFTIEQHPNDPARSLDPGYTTTQRGLGQLVGNVVQNQGTLDWKTRGSGARLKEITGGKEDRRIDESDHVLAYTSVAGVVGPIPEYDTTIVKPEAGETSSGQDAAIQISDRVIPAELSVDTSSTPNERDGLSIIPGKSQPLWGENLTSDDLETDEVGAIPAAPIREGAFEVFAVHADRDVTPLHIIADALGDDFRYHPLTYYAAFHLSTRQTEADPSSFDVLRPDWALNAKWLFTSTIVADIKQLVRERPNQTVKRIALGKDNNAVQIRRFCVNVLLHGHGYYEATASGGSITVERVKTPTIQDHDDALGRPVKPLPSDTLVEDPARDRTKSAIQVTLGDTDFTEGRSLFVRGNLNTEQRWQDLDDNRQLEIDLSTADPQDFEAVQDRLIDLLQMQSHPQNRLRFLAEDHTDKAASYDIGEFVNLGNIDLSPEWIVDNDGNRVQNFAEIEATGIIVGRTFHLTDQNRSKAYTLTVIFVGDQLTRWRAPSGKIQSVTTDGSGNHVLTLRADDGTPSHFGQIEDDTGNAQSDAGLFSVGDEVEVYAPDGQYWSSNAIKEVTAVDENNDQITVSGTWSSDPPTGHFIELAHIDSDGSGTGYVNNGLNGTFDNIDRAYVFLSDTDDTIGDAGLEADQYGA